MKKAITFLFFMNALCCNVFSQQFKFDSLLLNNGKLYYGKVITYTPNVSVKIKTASGFLSFSYDDIQYIGIHSRDNYAEGFDISNRFISKFSTITGLDSLTTDTVRIVTEKHLNFEPDGLPVDLFMIQGGADGLVIYSLADIYSQHKLQAIYSHRFWKETALGIGYVYRDLEERGYHNLFFDIRYFNMIKPKKFSSFALDVGFGNTDFEYLLTDPTLYLNTSFNYGIRLDQYLFLTLGVDLNLQSNANKHYETYNYGLNMNNTYVTGYDNNFTFGFTVGILF